MSKIVYPKNVDLVVFAGQSNMSGRGDAKDAPLCIKNAGFEYKAVSNPDELVEIKEPFGLGEDKDGGLTDINKDGTTKRRGSMVGAFVNAYYEHTKRQIVAVSASKGGTNTEEWKSGLIDDAVSRLDRAKVFLKDNNIKVDRTFLVWSQGESDGDVARTKEDYIKNTTEIIGKFFEHGIEHCFIVGTGHYNYPVYGNEHIDKQYEVIRNAQKELADTDNRYTVVSSFLPYIDNMRDNFHYYQIAYNKVGTEAGENTARYYENE